MTDPSVSVVVPVYNDPQGLRDTLRSLTSQSAPRETYEVIVVDNNSTDSTAEVITKFEDRHPDLVTGIEETSIQSSYAARNAGIDQAAGNVLVFIDSDMTTDDSWIGNIRDEFMNSDVDYLGYDVKMYIAGNEDSFWGQYDVAMGLPVQHYMRTKNFAPTCALAVHDHVFTQVGVFDEELTSGGDKEFGSRVHNNEMGMAYTDDIVVHHPARETFSEHLKKAQRVGKGQAQLWFKHGLATSPLSPVWLLPPDPRRFHDRCSASGGRIPLYLATYLLKMIQFFSSLTYAVRNNMRGN